MSKKKLTGKRKALIGFLGIGLISSSLLGSKAYEVKKEKDFKNSDFFDSKNILIDYTFSSDKKIYIYSHELDKFLLLETKELISPQDMIYTNCALINSYLAPRERQDYYSASELRLIEYYLEKSEISMVRKPG